MVPLLEGRRGSAGLSVTRDREPTCLAAVPRGSKRVSQRATIALAAIQAQPATHDNGDEELDARGGCPAALSP